ncbi:MAG: hypothetical protein LBU65_07480 [Planctomycetaceae bacterium]|jgi:hypothetical protein|nr:hypothetical protein [Planctomycetaceae bacterium]
MNKKRTVVESSGHSLWKRISRILGSLTLAVVLLALLLVVLLWAVKVEMDYGKYGMNISQFAIYHSSWFALLLSLLGVNILFSIICRFPFKRYHFPFLLSHVGVVVLLFGCLLTWWGGDEAQMVLMEGKASDKAVRKERQFEVRSISMVAPDLAADSVGGTVAFAPFAPGPFSWSDYSRKNWFERCRKTYSVPLWLTSLIASSGRSRLRLTSDNNGAAMPGVNIKVLDFVSNVQIERPLPLELSVRFARPALPAPSDSNSGDTDVPDVPTNPNTPRGWESVSLIPSIAPMNAHYSSAESRQLLAGGERVVCWATDSPAEVTAFRESKPLDLPRAGVQGQIVLVLRGTVHHLNVAELVTATERDSRVSLGDSGFELSQVRYDRRGVVRALLHAPNGRKEQMILFSDSPEQNFQARQLGCFGTYWVDAELRQGSVNRDELPANAVLASQPRIDLLQAPNKKLFYRYWNGKMFLAGGEIMLTDKAAAPNSKIAAIPRTGEFSIAAGTKEEVTVVVENFYPADLYGCRFTALPLDEKTPVNPESLVRLRVKVDDVSEEFWLRAVTANQMGDNFAPEQVKYLYSKDRTVRIVWTGQVLNLGFGVYLRKAQEVREPGMRMAAQYSSLVDQIRVPQDNAAMSDPSKFDYVKRDVLIRMNHPGIFSVPGRWRTYRLYQSTMSGPFHPDLPDFFNIYNGSLIGNETRPRESLYMSGLSINYDPGRGLKYLGCFLLVAGLVWHFVRKSQQAEKRRQQ